VEVIGLDGRALCLCSWGPRPPAQEQAEWEAAFWASRRAVTLWALGQTEKIWGQGTTAAWSRLLFFFFSVSFFFFRLMFLTQAGEACRDGKVWRHDGVRLGKAGIHGR